MAIEPIPEAAARAFIVKHFPDASTVFLGGSAGRGEARAGSDLDLVIVTAQVKGPYRETFREFGWPIEAFVYTPDTYGAWFKNDAKRRRPSLPTMCAEGIVLVDREGKAPQIKAEARTLLAAGPTPLAEEESAAVRYRITDLLMDLESADEGELPFIAIALVPPLADLICDSHGQWRSDAKWVPRAIRAFSPAIAEWFETALSAALRWGDARPLIDLSDNTLAAVGGRLFEGYAAGKLHD